MEFLVIPSFPSFPTYEINESYEVKNKKTGRVVSQRNGIVDLYTKKFLNVTRRSVKKLYNEALSHHNQSHNPNDTSLAIHEEIPQEPQISSDELASILTRYKNIPMERLPHKECIDLLKTLMGKAKKVPVVKERSGDGYITPEEHKSIYERHKNRDYSGNNLKDVEEIYREYAPKKTHDTN